MALTTFPSLRAPSYGSARQSQPRVLEARFGDGYSQRAGDGLNILEREWTLSWNQLSTADADILDSYLVARGGIEAFWWTPPREVTAIKVICQDWRRQPASPGADRVDATFRQVFDL